MTGQYLPIETVADTVDPAMTLDEINALLCRLGSRYPTGEAQRLAQELATVLREAYLDAMCRSFLSPCGDPPRPA